MKTHGFLLISLLIVCTFQEAATPARITRGQALPFVENVSAQTLAARARDLINLMESQGNPVPSGTRAALNRALQEKTEEEQVRGIQAALDPLCLLAVHINPESRVKVAQGPATPELLQQDWRLFLVKIYNQAGTTAPLRLLSPNLIASSGTPAMQRDRWIDMKFNYQRSWISYAGNDPTPPPLLRLSGLEVEYQLIQFYSRDAGKRQAKISLDVGQGTQESGFLNEADILFNCLPTTPVKLRVRDTDGKPTMAMLTVRDEKGRTYPAQYGRLAPDFFFHPQIYRADGETVRLPKGSFTLEYGRGPEYRVKQQSLAFDGKPRTLSINLERWVDPSRLGWWSGDHHIHAAGCSHYTSPTAGVQAIDMFRHCQGEDLKVGCNLTWGPCFDFQKQYFTGKDDKVSRYPYLLRYDVEVSGFGSHQSGHLCLLRLKEQIYPGGDSYKHWPTLCLNTLKWAKRQGAVCGPAHSGIGLIVNSNELPNYIIPPFDGIGAMEYIVDVTHNVPGPDGKLVPAVDFMSTVDTPYLAELNIWYHTLNCGFRTRISGETDFPCITGERVGKGRSYVKEEGKLNTDAWFEGIRQGRCYVSDGYSHLMNFTVNGLGVGEKGSELRLEQPGSVRLTASVAALLNEKPDPSRRQGWYWHLERARMGASREVPVEVVVNGVPVARKVIVADGKTQEITLDAPIQRSSWVALRVLGSSHTNPVFVLVDNKPIRASRRSAKWCLESVDQCWSQKQSLIAAKEQQDAKAAYEHARETYRRILRECEID